MKKIIIAALIVVLLLAAMPFAVGWVAANRYQQLVLRLDTSSPDIKLEVVEYHRGLFSSQARLRATFSDPRLRIFAGTLGLSYDIDQSIAHGPLVPSGHGLALAIAGIHSQWHSSTQGPDIDLDGLLDLHANLNGSVNVADYDQINDQATIQLSGLKLDFSLNRDISHFDIHGGLESAAFTAASGEGITLKNLALVSTQDRGEHFPWVGPSTLSVARIGLSAPLSGQIDIGKLDIHGDSTVDGANRIQAQFRLGIDAATYSGQHYGPLDLRLKISNIDGQSMVDLSRAARQTQDGNAQMGLLMKSLPELLKARPVIALQAFSVVTPMGKLNSSLRVDIDQATDAQLASPFTLAQSVHATAHAQMDDGLARALAQRYLAKPGAGAGDVDAVLDRLVNKAVLNAVAGGYALDAEYQQGQLTLNGNPLTL